MPGLRFKFCLIYAITKHPWAQVPAGQKGVQRPVLSPGTLSPVHPVAFLAITKPQVYGVPVSKEMRQLTDQAGRLWKPERPAQQLSGLSEIPGCGRPDRLAVRFAAVRRFQPQSVPGPSGRGSDAGGGAGPGGGDQGIRRVADTGHLGRRFQIRESGPARPPRHLAGASANREVSHQSALLPGGGGAHVHHYAELGGRRVPGPQSRACRP